MSIIQEVAKAIREGLEKPRYVVKCPDYLTLNILWEVWDTKENRLIQCSHSHICIDAECDRLNEEWLAVKAIEAAVNTGAMTKGVASP